MCLLIDHNHGKILNCKMTKAFSAIVLIVSDLSGFFLKYYRGKSDGWYIIKKCNSLEKIPHVTMYRFYYLLVRPYIYLNLM